MSGLSNVTLFHESRNGCIWHGDSLDWMSKQSDSSFNLIMTSPPFGLIRKKSYGNETSIDYCEWFKPFAAQFHRILKNDGSLVIDIGGTWNSGSPTRSLYHFKLLIMLCEEYGFHLAMEHYWWNPAKLPSPIEWVNIRRVRPKDAVNCVWWLSKTPFPKASNRRVMVPYSDSMKNLLVNGNKPKLRPSGHLISDRFQMDNGGAVAPNLLAMANTESSGGYINYCKENGFKIHPARFPAGLPEYFIRMTTDVGDRVLDPFGGSCLTGAVSEALGRKFDCVEINRDFLDGAVGRFVPGNEIILSSDKATTYKVSTPCAIPIDEDQIKLVLDGGFKRP